MSTSSLEISAPLAADPSKPAEGTVSEHGKATRVTLSTEQPAAPAAPAAPVVPDKFKNADGTTNHDALLKSYLELESQRGKPAAAPAPAPGTPTELPAGVDTAALTAELQKNGELSEETYRSLAGKGLSKEVVDGYIAGRQAVANQFATDMKAHVGGEEAFRSMATWAEANFTDAQRAAYNKATASGDPELAKMALDGLKARYVAANGQEPQFVRGEGVRTAGVEPFASSVQLVEAMKDPRYRKDPAYRAQIEARLKVTSMFGR